MTPEGRRVRGRPKTTWRRTVEKERNKAGWKSREEAKAVAQDRNCWPDSMKALCAHWRNETWWWWWTVLTLDQIDQQSNEETCENERAEQVEELICGGQSEILLEKNEKWGFGGGGGEKKLNFIQLKCKWFTMNWQRKMLKSLWTSGM